MRQAHSLRDALTQGFFKKFKYSKKMKIYMRQLCQASSLYIFFFWKKFQASSLEDKNSLGWPGLLSPKGGGFTAWSTLTQGGANGSGFPELDPVASKSLRPEELPHYDEWKTR